MSAVWFDPTELMRACDLILAVVMLCCLSRFIAVRPYRTCFSNRDYKSKYEATSSHAFSVVRPTCSCSSLSSSRFDVVQPQAHMSSLWFDPTEVMRACGLILALVVLCCSSRFGVVRPYWTCLSNRHNKRQYQPKARMISEWFNPTKPASATEKYKSKYQSTISHEFQVVWPYWTSLSNSAQQAKYEATSSHEFGVVQPHQTCLSNSAQRPSMDLQDRLRREQISSTLRLVLCGNVCSSRVLRHRLVGVPVIQQSLYLGVVVLPIHHYHCFFLVRW